MQSIFHVKANTADELRHELVGWLETQAKNHEIEARTTKQIGRMNLANARAQVMTNAAKFWADIIIDPKSEGN